MTWPFLRPPRVDAILLVICLEHNITEVSLSADTILGPFQVDLDRILTPEDDVRTDF